MIQWFRGRLVASYVAEPSASAVPSLHGAAPHLAIRIYRAAAFELTLLEPPVVPESVTAAPDATATPESVAPAVASVATPSPNAASGGFHQPSIEDAHVRGIRGPGSRFSGPIFDVHVSELTLSHQTKHNGKAYGRMTGTLLAWCELPDLPARRAAAAPSSTPQAKSQAASPPVGELSFEDPQAEPDEPSDAQRNVRRASVEAPADELDGETLDEEPSNEEAGDQPPPAPRLPRGRGVAHIGPLASVALLVALSLGLASGLEPALLWCAFLIPTLLARALFHGVLRDSTGLRAFAFVLVLGQVLAASGLISSWWGSSCRHLELVPLLSIVAVLFPSGLLPSALPLVANAAGLALVLGLWSSAPESKCQDGRPRPSPIGELPTVKDPGVPRTNQDGSWPKRPPG